MKTGQKGAKWPGIYVPLLWQHFSLRIGSLGLNLKINLKMFGSISKDNPNMESSVPLHYI